jgi:hypothetical protein
MHMRMRAHTRVCVCVCVYVCVCVCVCVYVSGPCGRGSMRAYMQSKLIMHLQYKRQSASATDGSRH